MTDHRNTESPDRQSEAFMQAVEKGDTHRIEELLLQEEEDRFEDELRALWNEPSGDVEAHEIEDAFRSFKRRVRPLHHLKLKSLLRHVAAAAAVMANTSVIASVFFHILVSSFFLHETHAF